MRKLNYYFVVGIFNNGDREMIDRTITIDEAIFIAKYQKKFYNKVVIKYKDEIVFTIEEE